MHLQVKIDPQHFYLSLWIKTFPPGSLTCRKREFIYAPPGSRFSKLNLYKR